MSVTFFRIIAWLCSSTAVNRLSGSSFTVVWMFNMLPEASGRGRSPMGAIRAYTARTIPMTIPWRKISFSRLKCERLHFNHYSIRSNAQVGTFVYMEAFYNTVWLHSVLEQMSPQIEARLWTNPDFVCNRTKPACPTVAKKTKEQQTNFLTENLMPTREMVALVGNLEPRDRTPSGTLSIYAVAAYPAPALWMRSCPNRQNRHSNLAE